jgi:hypothetical protein
VSKISTSKIENTLAVFTIYYICDLRGTSYKMMSQNVRQISHQNSTTVRDSPSVIKPIGVCSSLMFWGRSNWLVPSI